MDFQMDAMDLRFMDISHRIDQLYADYAKSRGLSYMRFWVMEVLYRRAGDCTQKIIVDETHYPKQTVNLIIKDLLKQGYVALEELPDDRRNKRIALTESGAAWLEGLFAPIWSAEAAASARIPDAEWSKLLSDLRRYTEAFEREAEKIL